MRWDCESSERGVEDAHLICACELHDDEVLLLEVRNRRGRKRSIPPARVSRALYGESSAFRRIPKQAEVRPAIREPHFVCDARLVGRPACELDQIRQ